MPTLPLAITALIATDSNNWVWQAASAKTEIYDDFMTEFWLKPVKISRADGTETPFWAFYDYEAFRDRLLTQIVRYYGPRGQRIEFRRMTIESDQFAVVLSFMFRAHFKWCPDELPEEPGDGAVFGNCEAQAAGKPQARIIPNLCKPVALDCGTAFCEKETDPCSSP
jgi:hypothetical protein